MAVTRAQNQLWIIESDASAAESVVELLTHNANRCNPLVEVVRSSDPNYHQSLERLRSTLSNDPKKHSEMGYKLLQRKLFEEVVITLTHTPALCLHSFFHAGAVGALLKEKGVRLFSESKGRTRAEDFRSAHENGRRARL